MDEVLMLLQHTLLLLLPHTAQRPLQRLHHGRPIPLPPPLCHKIRADRRVPRV